MKQIQEELEKSMESGPAFHAVQIGTVVIDLAISITMIVSGMGLLQLRPWGRLLSIVYAVISIGLKLFEAVYAFAYTIPEVNEFLKTHTASSTEEQFAFSFMRMLAIGSPIVQLVCMIYPIIVLVIMFRPSVAAAFRSDGGFQGHRDQSPSGEGDYEPQ